MKTANTLLLAIAILSVSGAAVFLGLQHLSLQADIARHNAVQGCMEISSFTSNQTENGIIIVEPVVSAYATCLELKGISIPQK